MAGLGENIPDRVHVAHHGPLESPLLAQDLRQQIMVGRGGNAVDGIVGTHDRHRVPLGHPRHESGQIGFVQVAGRDNGIEFVSQFLGTAMNGIMLQGGDCL